MGQHVWTWLRSARYRVLSAMSSRGGKFTARRCRERPYTAAYVETLESRALLTPFVQATATPAATLPGANTAWSYPDGVRNASPIVADVNHDGSNEVIVVAGDKTLVAEQVVDDGHG